MTREFISIGYKIDDTLSFDPQNDTLAEWLIQKADRLSWVLAYAHDGLIWGVIDEHGLTVSGELDSYISPPLRLETLQRLQLFNEAYEITLWRDNERWRAFKVEDDTELSSGAINEVQLLWGTYGKHYAENGFTRLKDGSQGLRHILPPMQDKKNQLAGDLGLRTEESIRRACIHVRHYLYENELGVNSIAMTRRVKLGVESYG